MLSTRVRIISSAALLVALPALSSCDDVESSSPKTTDTTTTSEASAKDQDTPKEDTTSEESNWGDELETFMLNGYGVTDWASLADKYPDDPKTHIVDVHSDGDALIVVTNLDEAGKSLAEALATQFKNRIEVEKESGDASGMPADVAEEASFVNVFSLNGDHLANAMID